jgi:hypothetical protein
MKIVKPKCSASLIAYLIIKYDSGLAQFTFLQTISLRSVVGVLHALASAKNASCARLDLFVCQELGNPKGFLKGRCQCLHYDGISPLPAGNFQPRFCPSGALSLQVFASFGLPHFGVHPQVFFLVDLSLPPDRAVAGLETPWASNISGLINQASGRPGLPRGALPPTGLGHLRGLRHLGTPPGNAPDARFQPAF